MNARRRNTILLLAALGAVFAPRTARATEIAVLFSSGIDPYTVAYEGFAEVCPANYWKVDLSRVDGEEEQVMRDLVGRSPDLVLALGTGAYRAAVRATDRIPIVFVLVLDYGEELPANVAGASARSSARRGPCSGSPARLVHSFGSLRRSYNSSEPSAYRM